MNERPPSIRELCPWALLPARIPLASKEWPIVVPNGYLEDVVITLDADLKRIRVGVEVAGHLLIAMTYPTPRRRRWWRRR